MSDLTEYLQISSPPEPLLYQIRRSSGTLKILANLGRSAPHLRGILQTAYTREN